MLIAMKQCAAFTVTTADKKLFSELALTEDQANRLAGADISVQVADVYIRFDGGGTADNGMLIKANTIFRLNSRTEVLNCLLYASSGTDATVVATAYQGV